MFKEARKKSNGTRESFDKNSQYFKTMAPHFRRYAACCDMENVKLVVDKLLEKYGEADKTDILLALVNSKCPKGKTALHCAAERAGYKQYKTERKDKAEIINWLSMNGADFSQKDNTGKKATDVARTAKTRKLIRVFEVCQAAIVAAHKIFTYFDAADVGPVRKAEKELFDEYKEQNFPQKKMLALHELANSSIVYTVISGLYRPVSLLSAFLETQIYSSRCGAINPFVKAVLDLYLRKDVRHIEGIALSVKIASKNNHFFIVVCVDETNSTNMRDRLFGTQSNNIIVDAYNCNGKNPFTKLYLTKYPPKETILNAVIESDLVSANPTYEMSSCNILSEQNDRRLFKGLFASNIEFVLNKRAELVKEILEANSVTLFNDSDNKKTQENPVDIEEESGLPCMV